MVTVENLFPYLRPEFIFANRSASVDQVRTLMLLHRIARVPIIDGSGKNGEPGGRTCRGIVRMRAFFDRPAGSQAPLNLEEVMTEAPPEISVDEPLFRAVERLRGRPEVLIRGANKLLIRMLTPRGLADWLRAYSEPFLVVEELEKALRDMLRPFEGDTLCKAVGVERVDLMNPAHYRDACDKLWTMLSAVVDLDKTVVLNVLNSLARQRNALMHFRLDDRDALNPYLRQFNELGSRIRRTVPVRTI